VDECRTLLTHGIAHNDFVLKFTISAVVCDAPARAFLKNIKGHTSYSACERCSQSGAWNGKMTFPEVNAEKRTDASFDEMRDADHHKGRSPLSELGIGMVSMFVLDYMHLICLGVVRRLIWLWLLGPVATNCRIGASCIQSISDKLISLRSFVPFEFARKPRSLHDWQRWKATEFRQFLLYTGPVVLLGKLSEAAYRNFMLLSVGMFILLDKHSSAADIDYAEELLVLFVQHFSSLYGSNMMVYNVHNVVHIADDARTFGNLDNVSAFCFENFLGGLVKLVRKPCKPLEQVVRRLLEQQGMRSSEHLATESCLATCPTEEHHNGPLPNNFGVCRQFRKVTVNGALICLNSANNCISIDSGDIVVIRNIVVKHGETLLVYQQFNSYQSFFTYPLDSSRFGIYRVSHLRSEWCVAKLSDFRRKNVMLPFDEEYVVIPLLHM
jgi:hypothetical protein